MKKNDLVLPRKYEDRNRKYPEHKGKYKLSNSQATSYNDEEYQSEYYLQYFLGVEVPGNDFSEFGNGVGDYISSFAECKPEIKNCLTDKDIEHIHKLVFFPPNCIYEDEICVDFGDFVVEGYIDRCEYLEDGVKIVDYKTLNIDTKSAYYASDDYRQTVLYAFQKEREGHKILESSVHGLGRKGSSIQGTGNFKMRLSGLDIKIPTPYSKERAEEMQNWFKTIAHQISEDYKVYLKVFKN